MECLLGLGEWCEETAVQSATKDKPLPPRLPSEALAYVFRGRSSDSAGSTLLAGLPSALRHQCHLGLSYLLTAAGQFRIHTGFPFDAPCGATMEETTISWVSGDCKSIRCGYLAEGKSRSRCCRACLW